MKDALSQVARTAALCGALGAGLYLVISGLAEWAAFPAAFALFACLAVMALCGATLRQALGTGVFPMRPRAVLQDREPVVFRFFVAWTLLWALASLALAVHVGARLLSE